MNYDDNTMNDKSARNHIFICHNAKKELCAPNGIVGFLATLKGRICICAASLSIMI